jgi:integrase
MRVRLTKAAIARLTPQPNRAYDVRDTQVSRLVVRVRPSGAKSYLVRLKDPEPQAPITEPGTKQPSPWYWYTVGPCDAFEPDEARQAAASLHGQAAKARLGAGLDPRAEDRRRRQDAAESRRKAITLREFLSDTYEPWVLVNRRTGAMTVTRIRSVFKDLLDTPLADLGTFALERWRTARRKDKTSDATVNRDVAALKGMLRYAKKEKAITVNPLTAADDFKPLKVDRFGHRLRYLSPDEEKRLLAALVARDDQRRAARASGNAWLRERGHDERPELGTYTDLLTPMVTMLLHTGLRFGEACSLTWGDVDVVGALLTVRGETTKTQTTRYVPLNKTALDTLKTWKPERVDVGAFVFPGRDAKRLVDIKTAWKQIIKAATITGFRVHDLRHTFASKLVQAGVDLNTVRELLGHSDIKMTLRYAHLAPEHRAAAVAKVG